MAHIHNSDIIKNIIDKAKIQTSHDSVPTQLAEKIIPVMEVDPYQKSIEIASSTASDSTGATIHTTHPTRKTFIIGAQMTVAKDAVSDSIFSAINATINGKAVSNILIQRYEPTTANEFLVSIFFPPIELEKNSQVTINNEAATASIDATGIIYFYEKEE